MVINNNTVEQINVALLNIDKKLSQINADKSAIESLRNDVSAIKRTLNETTYQKVDDKNSVAGYVHCDKTANGTYILKATVTNGNVTYAWVQET